MDLNPQDDNNTPHDDTDASLSRSVESLLASIRASPGRTRDSATRTEELAAVDGQEASTDHIPPLSQLSLVNISEVDDVIQQNGHGHDDLAASHTRSKHARTLSCCCGQDDCAFQKRGEIELKNLENDVRAAATVGQALLVRHQTYAADAERDRSRLNLTIADLERRNKELEVLNAQLLEENKALVEQVEGLNNAITDSDAHIKSVTATLQSTQHELQKFSALASRADSLEEQVRQMEAEQGHLHASLTITEKERKDAMQKWRTSQRRVTMLQEQLDTIDHEATEERRRHAEVVERMARRRAMELELGPDSGVKSEVSRGLGHQKKGSETVSSFVKQILHDNSNMELTMVELQQLLTNSQNEVESLRDKLLDAHLAANSGGGGGVFNGNQLTPNLEAELGDVESPFYANQAQEPSKLSQELHVHHHFHALTRQTPVAARSRSTQLLQRPPRRKRLGSTGGRSTPVSSTERESRRSRSSVGRLTTDDLPSPALSQSVDRSNRWSFNSASSHRRANSLSIISSAPSSPPSAYAHSAIFERGLGEDDRTDYSSRPTSPESNAGAFWSPVVKPTKHRKEVSRDSLSQQPLLPAAARPNLLGVPSLTTTRIDEHDVIPEQESEDPPSPKHQTGSDEPEKSSVPGTRRRTPTLHRSASNSSLTISGMDIHSTLPTPTRLLPRQPTLAQYGKTGAAALTASTALSHQHASASRSQKAGSKSGSGRGSGTINTGSASAWRMLRGKLESDAVPASTDVAKSKSYSPFLDTLGGWFSSGNKANVSSPSGTEASTTLSAAEGAKSPADSMSIKSAENDPTTTTATTTLPSSSAATSARPIPTPQKRPNLSSTTSDPITSLATSANNNSSFARSLTKASPGKRAPMIRPSGVNQAGGLPLYPPGMRHSGRVRVVKKPDEDALMESLLEEASPSLSTTSSTMVSSQQPRPHEQASHSDDSQLQSTT